MCIRDRLKPEEAMECDDLSFFEGAVPKSEFLQATGKKMALAELEETKNGKISKMEQPSSVWQAGDIIEKRTSYDESAELSENNEDMAGVDNALSIVHAWDTKIEEARLAETFIRRKKKQDCKTYAAKTTAKIAELEEQMRAISDTKSEAYRKLRCRKNAYVARLRDRRGEARQNAAIDMVSHAIREVVKASLEIVTGPQRDALIKRLQKVVPKVMSS